MNKLNAQLLHIIYSLCLVLIFFSQPVEASIDKEYLQQLVKETVIANISSPEKGELDIEVSEIDPRINLEPCDKPVQVELLNPDQPDKRHFSVKLFCDEPANWQLYLTVRVSTVVPVVTAASYIAKGSLLTEENLTIEHKPLNRLRGEYFSDFADFIGAKSIRNLRQGTVINRRNICTVCDGETVTVIAQSPRFSIKTIGIAMQNGQIGDEISIKNKQSGKIIRATIIGVNQVKITL
jgi:flagella basal body P-ring formation protein FlgA